MLLALTSLAGCQCADGDLVELDSDSASGASGEASDSSAASSESSTGEPFDASRWIGRYHFEHPFLPFGERGDALGTETLANFEILPDSRATMFHDRCSLDEPIITSYVWHPSEEGWLSLEPGPGDTSLRFLAVEDVETLRVQLTDPCRALRFEVDGVINTAFVFRPGESCWVDRCTTPGIMHIDYCEGEEPEEACP